MGSFQVTFDAFTLARAWREQKRLTALSLIFRVSAPVLTESM
jgi:hypothetical protein